MLNRRTAILLAFTLGATGLLASHASQADAAKYVVYLHGRSMTGWPVAAKMFTTTTYTHKLLSYNGSARITDSTVRNTIKGALSSYCRGSNTCVAVCYSTGCPRLLLAIQDLKAAGTPATGILWTEALASSAGGTELAEIKTSGLVRLLAKLFVSGIPGGAPVDQDLTRNVMRVTYGYMQNGAPSPVYHLAGKRDICIKIKILKFIKVKLCANKQFPGGYGDGVVPVHSAGGFSNSNAHSSLSGTDKYTFRAYEQTALFDKDHRGGFEPLVQFGSLRLAVAGTKTCANAIAAGSEAAASIVYQDADGPVDETWSPMELLKICGNDLFTGNGETAMYASCIGQQGCCSNFSNGTNTCTCGEALCAQPARSYQSFFTGVACTGIEYTNSNGDGSWDGLGMRGAAAPTVTTRSMRDSAGVCRNLTTKRTWSGSCAEYNTTSKSYPYMHRIYRTTALPIVSANSYPGYVVNNINLSGYCP